MIRTFLFFIVCLYSCIINAQLQDSLVRQNDLVFENESEKKIFLSSAAGNSFYLDIFLSSYAGNKVHSTASALSRINNCVSELKEGIEGKPETKQVKYIYKYIHEKFFTKYENNNSFSDIFEKGYYNCVSSTALYAIVFEKLGIPYRIMEKPEHVFLIAYPQTFNIYIETTIPENGYIHFPDTYVQSYIEYLYKARIISQQQYESGNFNKLFEEYYYSSKPISLRNLAAIQFSNFSLYQMEGKDYAGGVEDIKKACYLHDFPRNRYLLKQLLMYEVSTNNYNDQRLVKNLSILFRFNAANKQEIPDQALTDEFRRLTQHQLIDKSDLKKYDESYKIIVASISDSLLQNAISFVYHYEFARLGLLNTQLGDVYSHLKKAYAINPENADLRNMIVAEFGRKVENSNEAGRIIRLSSEYMLDFSFLSSNTWFNSIKSNCILQLSYQNFLSGYTSKGEDYLGEFESICRSDSTVQPKEIFVEKAYSEGASYYYKKGNIKRCRELLRRGLLYAPESFALRMRLNQS